MAKPEARKNARSVVASLVVMVFLGAIAYMTSVAQSGWPLTPRTTVRASIDNIQTLAVNDDVREHSRRVGRVSAINYEGGKALVTLELEGAPNVYNNARAAIWDQSTLAMKFVELDPGTPHSGKLGNRVIPASHTEGSADLQQLLAVLDPNTRAQATSTLREVGGGVAGHSQDIHDFLGAAPGTLNDLGTTSQALSSEQMNLPSMLQSADQLASRFNGREAQISALVKQTNSTLNGVAVDQGKPLQDALSKAPATLRDVRGSLHSLDDPLANVQVAAANLGPGAASLGASTPDLRGTLREAVPVLNKVPGVAEHAEPAVGDLQKTFADARPLAPKVVTALGNLATPLKALAPYGPEIGQFFVRGHSFVSEGPAPGIRYARLSPNVSAGTATGGLFGSDNYPRDEYPKPGQATGDRDTSGLPPGLPPSGGK